MHCGGHLKGVGNTGIQTMLNIVLNGPVSFDSSALVIVGLLCL